MMHFHQIIFDFLFHNSDFYPTIVTFSSIFFKKLISHLVFCITYCQKWASIEKAHAVTVN